MRVSVPNSGEYLYCCGRGVFDTPHVLDRQAVQRDHDLQKLLLKIADVESPSLAPNDYGCHVLGCGVSCTL